jgi:hypothetical protein
MAVQGVRLAARGYAFSEYILSEEFILAWRLLLDQLGEFVDDSQPSTSSPSPPPPTDAAAAETPPAEDAAADAPNEGGSAAADAAGNLPQTKAQVQTYRAQASQVATATKQRAAVAFDLCKRE